MQDNPLEGPGIYSIILYLPQDLKIEVGSLGTLRFPEGYYSYTGSARGPGGLARVKRHREVLTGERKTRRWHIDYLLPHCRFVDVVATKTDQDLECEIASEIAERLRSIKGFGCTDCRCKSHLHHCGDETEMMQAVRLTHASAEEMLKKRGPKE